MTKKPTICRSRYINSCVSCLPNNVYRFQYHCADPTKYRKQRCTCIYILKYGLFRSLWKLLLPIHRKVILHKSLLFQSKCYYKCFFMQYQTLLRKYWHTLIRTQSIQELKNTILIWQCFSMTMLELQKLKYERQKQHPYSAATVQNPTGSSVNQIKKKKYWKIKVPTDNTCISSWENNI